jgi:hypothetical protein
LGAQSLFLAIIVPPPTTFLPAADHKVQAGLLGIRETITTNEVTQKTITHRMFFERWISIRKLTSSIW